MDNKEIIAAVAICVSGVLSLIAIFVSLYSLWKTLEHNQIMRGFAAAGPELQLLVQINAARKDIEAVLTKLTNFHTALGGKKPNQTEAVTREGIWAEYQGRIEAMLNIYETACGLYLDQKIDPVRFKKYYHDEIKTLMEKSPDEIKKRLSDITSKFKAIRKVYQKWHDLEK